MKDAANLDGIGLGADEEEPVVTNAQPKFFSPFKSFHVAYTRFRKAMQRGENMHSDRLAQTADIAPSWISPNDPLHFVSRKRSISS